MGAGPAACWCGLAWRGAAATLFLLRRSQSASSVAPRAATVPPRAASTLRVTSGGLIGSAVLGQVFDNLGWPVCVAGVGVALLAAAFLAIRLEMPSIKSQG